MNPVFQAAVHTQDAPMRPPQRRAPRWLLHRMRRVRQWLQSFEWLPGDELGAKRCTTYTVDRRSIEDRVHAAIEDCMERTGQRPAFGLLGSRTAMVCGKPTWRLAIQERCAAASTGLWSTGTSSSLAARVLTA